jgi:hypothetical protein
MSKTRKGKQPSGLDCADHCTEVERLKQALWSMWYQYAWIDDKGNRHTSGLSALEDCAEALGIEAGP